MLRCGAASRLHMRVICLTAAPGGPMTDALRRLDYTPYTFRSAFSHGRANRHPVEWAKALLGEREGGLKSLMADFDASVGPPVSMLYADVLRECPAYTRVILVKEGDKQQWARDHERCVARVLKGRQGPPKNRIAGAFHTMVSGMAPAPPRLPSETLADVGDEERRIAGRAAALERYEADVCRHVPPSQLLVYHYGDGWEPLCSFLGKQVPNEPFPQNDNGLREIRYLHERVERTEKITFVGVALLGCAVAYAFSPALMAMKGYFEKLYRDYQIAYAKG